MHLASRLLQIPMQNPHNMTPSQFLQRSAIVVFCVVFLIYGMASSGLSGGVNASGNEELEIVSPLILTPSNPVAGQIVTTQFAVRNAGTQEIHLERLGVAGRGPGCIDWSCENYQDFPFHQHVSLAPGQTYTYSAQRIFLAEGGYFVRLSYESPSSVWSFLGDRINFYVSAGLQVTKRLSLAPSDPHTNELVFADYQLHNASNEILALSRVGVGARGPDCPPFDWGCPMNVDFEYYERVSLIPGETQSFKFWRLFAEPGSYFVQIAIEDSLGIPTVPIIGETT